MNILKTVTTTVFSLALMGAVFLPAAQADEWNRKTTFTFSRPVEIPGVHLQGRAVLPGGTYVELVRCFPRPSGAQARRS
jgi:hypothetical protein